MVQGAVLIGCLLLVAVPLAVALHQPEDERRRLLIILGVALALRILVMVVLDRTEAWHLTPRGATTPDERATDLAARLLASGDQRSPVALGGSLYTSWLIVSWAVYDLVWDSLLAVKLLNTLIGTVLVVPVYTLAKQLSSVAGARIGAWAVALFPTAIVWSALALRDPLIVLLVTTIAALAVHPVAAMDRRWWAWVMTASSALTVLAFTRAYMVPLLAVVLLATAALRRVRQPAWPDLAAPVAALVIGFVAVIALPAGTEVVQVTAALVGEPAGNIYNPLSDCTEASSCEVVDAEKVGGAPAAGASSSASAVDAAEDDEVVALEDSLQSVEQRGLVRAGLIAFLAGRPVWNADEFFLLLQPGVVIWWSAVPLITAGSVVLARHRRWDALVATSGLLVAVIVFLALTGQFIRHHFMIEPLGLALAAIALDRSRDRSPDGRGWMRALVTLAVSAMALAASLSVIASLVG